MNDFERARARRKERMQRNLCPYCVTMLAFPEKKHRCPHDEPCELEEAYEFKLRCHACRNGWWQRERLRTDLPRSALDALRDIDEGYDPKVSARRAAWKELGTSMSHLRLVDPK